MLSLIIPIYRNQDSIPALLKMLENLHIKLIANLEVVFVVDASPDLSYDMLLRELPSSAFRSKLVLLSRNFGPFEAIRAGLSKAEGEYFCAIAADLQEPPELVSEMLHILTQDESDVVLAVRHTRADPWMTRFTAGIFWKLYRYYVLPEMPKGSIGAFACNRVFKDQLLTLKECHGSWLEQIFWLGYRRKFVSYAQQKRKHGRSAWTLRKKINYFVDSIFSLNDFPIRLFIYIGSFTAFISGLVSALVILFKLLGLIAVPGYAAIILAIIFFGSVNLLGLGIAGFYAWRAYENSKERPSYIILRDHQFNQSANIYG